jgi:hypothetical protein
MTSSARLAPFGLPSDVTQSAVTSEDIFPWMPPRCLRRKSPGAPQECPTWSLSDRAQSQWVDADMDCSHSRR